MLKKIFLIIGLAFSAPTFVEAAQTVVLDVCVERNADEPCNLWLGGAAYKGHEACVQALIQKGADIEEAGKHGDTPLHFAARQNEAGIAALLIQAGANVNAKNPKGETPLHLAIEYNSYNAALRLLKHGADVAAQDNIGNTPLTVARTTQKIAQYIHDDRTEEQDRADLVALLINNGAEVPAELENEQVIKDAREILVEWAAYEKFEFRTNAAYIVGGTLSVIGIPLLGYQLNKEYTQARLEVIADSNQKQICMTAKELRAATLKRAWQNIKARPWKQQKALIGGVTATSLGLGTLLATWITVKIKGD